MNQILLESLDLKKKYMYWWCTFRMWWEFIFYMYIFEHIKILWNPLDNYSIQLTFGFLPHFLRLV